MSAPDQKACFVAMPISTPDSYAERLADQEHFSHVLEHLFCPALQRLGFRVIPPSAAGADVIHAEIIRNLEQADLVLCDLSSLNPNVFFELGIRTALDRPVVLVKDSDTAGLPFDLAAVNTHSYNPVLRPWFIAEEIPKLAAHIQSATKDDLRQGNSMWRYFGLTKPASPSALPDNPVEAKLDIILKELEKADRGKAAAEPALSPGPTIDDILVFEADVRRLLASFTGATPRFRWGKDHKAVTLTISAGIPPEIQSLVGSRYPLLNVRWIVGPGQG